MLRRLYFLFPDEPHAQRAVDDLISLDISQRRIHAIAKNVELKSHVIEIERFIHHKYPAAVVGGVSWSVDAFGL